ncbi:TPA: alkylhydroperoxidase domain protein [Serratia rubidaea]|uniref:alkylhydroperoxidase domain protein n=1 Tax=Serratia rubidaea TaxID=61652 RepID=UPI0023B1D715|nr:alkylhydroperoxidase domain protein [Serratia rubidaea]MDK1702456.1 alkylhydroperoxidase domain protein [Serratia rubidaea]HDJ1439457.1 alkylhydroperoxidase domain protein [Serratia rubidaea]HDJ1448142.1 alkylhydroperoxidase domain protein [Serratia rubidaea]HDJ1463153.1 alkylhydroperoxidase domain protein [Serratia rubidaea]HDJ2770905.1 alkylhydroperoxidase domain protein [Serratia rubidaea]
MTDSNDLLATLAQAERSAELTQARITRQGASDAIQASYHALFDAEEEDFPADERALLAQRISEWHGASALAAHYAARQQRRPATTPRLSAALDHAERLAFKPAEAAPEHLQALQQAGWSPAAIVTLSQLIAFVSFQSRLLYGYRLLAGDVPPVAAPVPAANWRRAPLTHGGRSAPPAFTRQELGWEPWIAAKPLAEFDAAGLALLARFGHTDSDYFRLLARNHPLLEQRTLADRAIFYTSGGLARQDRELAATVASKVNGCIYCASVHARKAAQLSKREEEVQRLLDVAPGGVLSAGQQEAWSAQIEFAAALSATPPRADAEQLATLRRQGLSELALLDLVQSTAFFAWANRLMLTLGEPFEP